MRNILLFFGIFVLFSLPAWGREAHLDDHTKKLNGKRPAPDRTENEVQHSAMFLTPKKGALTEKKWRLSKKE